MSTEPLPVTPLTVTWTSTMGSPNDGKFIDKLIRYGGVLYQCFPLNHPAEISKRPHSFCYEAVEKRILRDAEAIDRTLADIGKVLAEPAIHRISADRTSETAPYWNNGFFNGADASHGYAMVAALKPQLILEVGAGNSTKFFRRAIEDYGLDTRLVAIDPAPRADITAIADEILIKSVFDVDLAYFDRLQAGDFLFWDGSHVVSNGADITRLVLEIIPRLKPGVIVHIHDIVLPFEASFNGQVGDVSFPENYMVACFILYNDKAKVLLPVHYLQRKGRIQSWGGSFWFQTG